MDGLKTLDALLACEEEELLQRVNQIRGKRWRVAFVHKARTIALVRGWIADLISARRPGAGGYSRGANHFHEHGELLAAFEQSECLSAMAKQRAGDAVSDGQIDAVQ